MVVANGHAALETSTELAALLGTSGTDNAPFPDTKHSASRLEFSESRWPAFGELDSDEASPADAGSRPTFVQVAGAEQYTVDKDVVIEDAERRAAADGAPQTVEYTQELMSRISRMHNFVSHDYDPLVRASRRCTGAHKLEVPI
jgi:hypothetical protein